MRIKRVVIEAFASYDKIEMKDEFSPGCNLILGKNGCGKSNFLQGKCLKQKLTHLSQQSYSRSVTLGD